MSKNELDDEAYEALKAHPVMVEEAMTNKDGAFWAKFTQRVYGKGLRSEFLAYEMRDAIEVYVKDQVQDLASDEEISVNEAIHKLLNRCNR